MTARVLLIILLTASNFLAFAEIVEEVVAAVDTTPILSSDIALAELVGLAPAAVQESATEHFSRLLDARIRLELQYRDLEASGTLYRLELDTVAVVDAFVEHAGGAELLDAELAVHGLTRTDLEELALRLATASAYVEQRLRPRITISLEELQAAYQQEVVDVIEARGGAVPPITAVQDELHRLLVERKLNDEIADWIAGARERHEVTRFVR